MENIYQNFIDLASEFLISPNEECKQVLINLLNDNFNDFDNNMEYFSEFTDIEFLNVVNDILIHLNLSGIINNKIAIEIFENICFNTKLYNNKPIFIHLAYLYYLNRIKYKNEIIKFDEYILKIQKKIKNKAYYSTIYSELSIIFFEFSKYNISIIVAKKVDSKFELPYFISLHNLIKSFIMKNKKYDKFEKIRNKLFLKNKNNIDFIFMERKMAIFNKDLEKVYECSILLENKTKDYSIQIECIALAYLLNNKNYANKFIPLINIEEDLDNILTAIEIYANYDIENYILLENNLKAFLGDNKLINNVIFEHLN